MDNTAIERIAAKDLTDDALALLERYGANDDVVFFLGRLVWQGEMVACTPALLNIAVDPNRGRYARIAAVRGVMSVGTEGQKDSLWRAIAEQSGPHDHRVIAEILDWAAPTLRSVELLLQTLEGVPAPQRYEVTGVEQAFATFIERLPVMADATEDQPLARLVEGLHGFLVREPFMERGECHVSETNAWLMAPALKAVDRLVGARSAASLSPAAIGILQNTPALRYWQGRDHEDYTTSLAQNVPRWRELNDSLYWASIAAARQSRDERLVDDWPVTFLGHFWAFGLEDFERCLAWVRERNGDDRLVALSRCLQIFVQADRPLGWREALLAVVEGHAELTSLLESRLDPTPTPAMLKSEARHLAWKKEREAEDQREAEQRADWIRELQSDPERVRAPPGLKPGEVSTDQAHMLDAIMDDSGSNRWRGSNWRSLIPEFGEPVARAYRDAAVGLWRHNAPALKSEGEDTSRIPFVLIFGLAGLTIEAAEDDGFAQRLSDDEVRRALRYVTHELNGFPEWFEDLYRAHPTLGLEAVRKELIWNLEARNAEGGPVHYILHDIVHYAPWIHADVAPILLDWLNAHDPSDTELLRHAISIMIGGGIAPQALAGLAAKKAQGDAVPSQRPRWFALWADTDPASAIPALEAELGKHPAEQASAFVQHFIVALVGGRNGGGTGLRGYRNVADLKRLYVLAHQYIRAEDDIERAGKGVYSPTTRDDAQEARNWLFNQLAEEPGPEAHAAIKSLAHEHPAPSYRRWMMARAFERATKDADEPLWTVEQVREFTRTGTNS